MTDLAKHIAAVFPLPFFKRRAGAWLENEVIFPFYHTVSDMPLRHLNNLYAIRSSRAFERDLDFLLKHADAVSLKTMLSSPEPPGNGRPRMVLSFDDGLAQCHDTVMPILQRKGVPAVFFLNNDFIDNRGLFYRYKVSLLLEKLRHVSVIEKEEAAALLHCRRSGLRKALRNISYAGREITDHIAAVWGFSFEDYQRMNPVYMSSMQVKDLQRRGFEIGAHGTDHPWFSILTPEHGVAQVRKSMEDIRRRFSVPRRYFAFPFTDHGVSDAMIDHLFEKEIIHAGFGTAGLKEDRWDHYHQRIPMEFGRYSGKNVLKGELLRRYVRVRLNRNRVDRKYVPGIPEKVAAGNSRLRPEGN